MPVLVLFIQNLSLVLQKKIGMAKNLVIVESPAKKKIIQGYLGKEFIVESSIGPVSYTHLTLPTIRSV